jgi:ABC-type sulfate transport system permease subunit
VSDRHRRLLFMALFLVLPLAAVFVEALRKGFDAYPGKR